MSDEIFMAAPAEKKVAKSESSNYQPQNDFSNMYNYGFNQMENSQPIYHEDMLSIRTESEKADSVI